MTHPMSPGQQGAELECDPKHLDSGRMLATRQHVAGPEEGRPLTCPRTWPAGLTPGAPTPPRGSLVRQPHPGPLGTIPSLRQWVLRVLRAGAPCEGPRPPRPGTAPVTPRTLKDLRGPSLSMTHGPPHARPSPGHRSLRCGADVKCRERDQKQAQR